MKIFGKKVTLKGVVKTLLNPAMLLGKPIAKAAGGILKKGGGKPVVAPAAPGAVPGGIKPSERGGIVPDAITTLSDGTKITQGPRGSRFGRRRGPTVMSTTGAGKPVNLLGDVEGRQAGDKVATAPAVGVPEIDKQAAEERKRKLAMGKARTVLG